ncbi:hypothetical protein JQ628_16020 [Bradyrhizobium lablabi]|uniref:hypothetical protein n=1 Tax=Bradyrhizobium lablabi TaxID=722472 RepID=UPI001BA5872D|nr:hypothetical protein [Bradyrhizobium lablabi]MBR1123034.1 hypothetical protein [Bradyrhizobium lablabi]
MATREKRLAQFDGNGAPPADLPVEVLCEDHSGTYQLPFACRLVEGRWHNHESGGPVEANVIAWRMPRVKQTNVA